MPVLTLGGTEEAGAAAIPELDVVVALFHIEANGLSAAAAAVFPENGTDTVLDGVDGFLPYTSNGFTATIGAPAFPRVATDFPASFHQDEKEKDVLLEVDGVMVFRAAALIAPVPLPLAATAAFPPNNQEKGTDTVPEDGVVVPALPRAASDCAGEGAQAVCPIPCCCCRSRRRRGVAGLDLYFLAFAGVGPCLLSEKLCCFPIVTKDILLMAR